MCHSNYYSQKRKAISIKMNYNKTSTTKALQSVNDMSAQNKV